MTLICPFCKKLVSHRAPQPTGSPERVTCPHCGMSADVAMTVVNKPTCTDAALKAYIKEMTPER